MNYSTVLLVIFVFSAKQISSENPTIEAYKQLNIILNNEYQKDFAPNLGENKSLEVKISLHAMDLDFDEKEKKLNLDMYFRQLWIDSRLANPQAQEYILGGQHLLESIWSPDTFFSTSQSVRTIKYPKLNVFVKIEPNGTVFYSQRLQHTIHCHRKNENSMECPLRIESYGYTAKDIVYKLKRGSNSVTISKDVNDQDKEYQFVNSTAEEKLETHSFGVYSAINIKFVFEKKTEGSPAPLQEATKESVTTNDLANEGKKIFKDAKKLFGNIKFDQPQFTQN